MGGKSEALELNIQLMIREKQITELENWAK